MATMNISLPDALKAWAESRVAQGSYSNVSDYVRDLIRKEQDKARFVSEIQAAINEGEASGVSGRSFDDIVATARRRAADAA